MKKPQIRRVVRELGGPEAVARRLVNRRTGKRLSRAAVSKWPLIPPEYCLALSRMSGGKYQPGDFRPDVFGQAA